MASDTAVPQYYADDASHLSDTFPPALCRPGEAIAALLS